uniref:Uncharacterized protein n=1 Tax=Anguilla anguilla TaxID=7936 RepID=A0A0E9P948_ANGAN
MLYSEYFTFLFAVVEFIAYRRYSL